MENFERVRFDEENLSTTTSKEQLFCERECCSFLKSFTCYDEITIGAFRRGGLINQDKEIRLLKSKHAGYLLSYLEQLPGGFVSLDASRSWIVYWILHALYLLGELDSASDHFPAIIETLQRFQNKTGGFAGGPSQISQGAPNYAAVLSLLTIGTPEAYAIIDRPAMYNYFMSIKDPRTGGFRIHIVDGEVDSRGTYTILAIARLLNILTPELADGVGDFLLACQTYEGGFGGEPGNEAHGGYNFCAVAGLVILKRLHEANLPLLESWLLRRQTNLEGGFQGRTNKLVDSCYSFWQGAGLAIVNLVQHSVHVQQVRPEVSYDYDDLFDLRAYEALLKHRQQEIDKVLQASEANGQGIVDVDDILLLGVDASHRVTAHNGVLSCNQEALQRYITHCAQNIEHGGMRDKPGKARDFYHSCYALSGLSVAQRSIICGFEEGDMSSSDVNRSDDAESSDWRGHPLWYVRHFQSLSPVEKDVAVDDEEALPTLDDHFVGPVVYGDREHNLLEPTSIIFNIGLTNLRNAWSHFHAPTMVSDHAGLVAAYHQQLQQLEQQQS
jgi:protein farnesyltransferase subunit beta